MKKILILLAAVWGCLSDSNALAVQPTPREVVCSASKILLDEVFSITVRDAWAGVTYDLYKSGERVQSAEGTGADLVFTGAFGAGEFTVRDSQGQEMKNKISTALYWPLTYAFDRPSLAYSPPHFRENGGVHQFTLAAPPSLEPVEMDQLFARYNAGDYAKWDNRIMRIEVVDREKYFSGESFVYWIYHINVYCAPNVSSNNVIINNAGFKVYNVSSYGTFGQLGTGGQLTDWNVRVSPDQNGTALCLTGTQPLVTYELYNNGEFFASKLQDSDRDLYFYDLDPGSYTVKAVCQTASKDHDGVYEIQFNGDIQNRPCVTFDDAGPVSLHVDGGTRILSCFRKSFVTDEILVRNIDEFNAGSDNIKMQLAGSSAAGCDIELTWGPHYSSGELNLDSKFIFNGTSRIRFVLPGSTPIVAYDVESDYPSTVVRLSGSQVGVTYEVCYRDLPIGIQAEGTGQSIVFTNIPVGKVYTIRGRMPGVPDRKMNGAAILMADPESQFTMYANAISTKNYYDVTHSYTDITYYDGLGAPSQTVYHAAGAKGQNVIAPIVYDAMYRGDAKVLLPYPVNEYAGESVFLPEKGQKDYYAHRTDGETDNSAYTLNVYDESGLDRIRCSYRPGDVYRQNDKFTEYLYESNDKLQDGVFGFACDYDDGSIRVTGSLPSETLAKNTVVDENGVRTVKFTDANGNVVLDRRYVDNRQSPADTYYVYDPYYSRLCWVIPPEASALLRVDQTITWNDELADKYCYLYRYDGRGNMIERRLPGCAVESFVYDKGDRLVFSRDGNLHSRKQWLYHVWDNHGNLLRQNLLNYDISRADLQARYDDLDNRLPALGGTAELNLPYTPDGGAALVRDMASYVYGNVQYGHTSAGFEETSWTAPAALAFRFEQGYPESPLQNPRGLKTYEKLSVLGDAPDEDLGYVERTFFYDYKNRPIQVVERNPRGGVSRTCYAYDIPGNILRSKELIQPEAGAAADVLNKEYEFDNRRRITRALSYLNSCEPAQVRYEYNDLGQLIGRSTQRNSLLETMKYNLQGWQTEKQVKHFGDSVFCMRLSYYTPRFPGSVPGYTGNISEWTWQQGPDTDENTYAFIYDGLSRLTDTRQYVNGTVDDRFVEKSLSYDLNGNLRSLERCEQGTLKNRYVYRHDGNRLLALDDLAASPSANPNSAYASPAASASPSGFVPSGPVDSLGTFFPWGENPPNPDKPLDPAIPGKPTLPHNPDLPFYPVDPIDPVDPENPSGPDTPTDPVLPGGGTDGYPESEPPADLSGNVFSGPDYAYDAAGNMLYDAHAGLNIRYNHLNLLEKVQRGDAIVAKYCYLSDGTKFSAQDAAGNTFYYLGSLEYRKQGNALALYGGHFDGGRFVSSETASGTTSRLMYFVTDHLGSVRVVLNAEGEVVERNDYYPFGKRWNDGSSPLASNRHRYNGKEEQAFLGLPYTDYGARQYDPDAGIWHGMDKLSEKYYPVSPYAFCGNNPISYIDPDGRDRRLVIDEKNKIISVQATYYHDVNTGSYIGAGVKVFNDMENLSYTDENGTCYQVVFELRTSRSSNPKSSAERDPAGNYMKLSRDLGMKNGAKVLGRGGGKLVNLMLETINDDFITAHEIGHTLGAAMPVDGQDNHASEGLMVRSVNDPKKSKKLDQKSIDEIIEQGRGPVEEKKFTFWEVVREWFKNNPE